MGSVAPWQKHKQGNNPCCQLGKRYTGKSVQGVFREYRGSMREYRGSTGGGIQEHEENPQSSAKSMCSTVWTVESIRFREAIIQFAHCGPRLAARSDCHTLGRILPDEGPIICKQHSCTGLAHFSI
jgi:hypothetical protein